MSEARIAPAEEPSSQAEPALPSQVSAGRPPHRPWLRLALLSLGIAIALSSIVVASRAQPAPQKRSFDSRPLRRIKRENPDIVVIGNSMAGTRIHERTLDRLLEPRRSVVLTQGGSRIAVWYLMLKNYVIAGGAKPTRVLIFFRYTELTDLDLRESGMDRWQIDRASPERDPVVEDRLTPPPAHPVRRLSLALGALVPVDRLKGLADDPAARFGHRATQAFAPDVSPDQLPELLNAPFDLPNLRAAAAVRTVDDTPRVSEVVDKSMLPPLIELAHQHKIPVTFVRIRPQSVANGEPESRAVRRYVRDLKRYVERRGAGFVDMTDATWESAKLYRSGDHIAGRYHRHYTKLFYEHLPELFQ